MKVTILGSSAAMPTHKSHHSAHALNVHEQFYLIDCGEGTQRRLMECGINPLKINAIFISHLHGDHIYGLFPLISTLGLLGRKTPLKVFAPRPLDEILANHMKYFDAQLSYQVKFCEVHTRVHELIFENKVMEVYSIPLRHRVPAAGFLFREKTPSLNIYDHQIVRYGLGIAQVVAAKRGEDIVLGDGTVVPNGELTYLPFTARSYAYCSDTQYSAKVAEVVKGVDLLYHEATFDHSQQALAKQTGHSTASQAAKVAKMAGVAKLVLGHFSARYKTSDDLVKQAREIFPNTIAAHEGEVIEIPLKKC